MVPVSSWVEKIGNNNASLIGPILGSAGPPHCRKATRTVSRPPPDAGARRMRAGNERPDTDPMLSRFTENGRDRNEGWTCEAEASNQQRPPEPPLIDASAPDARCADAASPLLGDPRRVIGYETSAPVAWDAGNSGKARTRGPACFRRHGLSA